ncbi:MAG: S9 family peptidase [Anaerolineales bacterium]|nr:S9 family peptidase [Anaerolineales bacterium]
MTTPLSDRWKLRYRAPRVANCQIAKHAPTRGVIGSNQSGLFQLYAWDVPTGQTRQLTHKAGGQIAYTFSPDGNYLYFLQDEHGNELGHFARFPYASTLEAGPVEDLTPDLPKYSPAGNWLSRSGRVFGFTAGTQAGFDTYLIELGADGSIGAPRKIFHSQPLAFGPVLSYDGDLAVMQSTEKSGKPEFCLIALDAQTGERIAELWDGENTSIDALMFSPVPGEARFLARSNRSGTETLLIWNPRTGERTDLVFPGVQGSANALDWTDDGRILFRTFNQAVQQFYVFDEKSGMVTKLDHPSGTLFGSFFAPTGEIFAQLEDAAHPTRLVALDGQTGKYVRDVLSAGEVPVGHAWRSVSFPSSDGASVQGWLATPDGEGPFPTIVDMIGGPGGVQANSFNPGSQAWVDHGFAFLSVNYRGCSSFGKEHETKIFGNPGYWEVEDLVAARQWLVDQGIAHPEQVFLTGWSYGGYLTLMGVGARPELWAGGMAGIAIADWRVQWEDTAPMLRGYQEALLGGTPTENPEQYAKSSPITYAERVNAPVLIIQGRNDTRTPARPIEMYEQKLQALGKNIQVVWFETGHGGSFMDVELGVRHQERMLDFAHRALDAPGI